MAVSEEESEARSRHTAPAVSPALQGCAAVTMRGKEARDVWSEGEKNSR